MDIDYDDFLAMFPMTQERPFSKEELAVLEARVPESVLALLAKVGVASSKGFFFTLAPGEADAQLETWGVNPAAVSPFLATSFGLVIFATPSQVGAIDPFTGKGSLWEPALARHMVRMDLVHNFEQFEKRNLAAVGRDEVWAMHPPVKLGGHFGDGVGTESNVTFERERREASVIAQASLYGHRVKGLPKSVMLTKAARTSKAGPTTSGATKPRTRRPG
ncbi:MAG: hypothetical protein Q8S33_31825 [Myxococcales bacterium]|nr:hypothetical protein [Myxococcales bacterium]